MQHSHEALDRAGGLSRTNLLQPLAHRDFRWMWLGQTASLLGDGVFLVAMAWQVYELSNAPTALSMVGIAMTIPTITFLLIGGVLSDRLDRRRVMLAADVLRLAAVGLMALLALTGTLELWHMVVLVALYGSGTAFFGPAFDAVVPDVLPSSLLPQANALDQFIRPIALRMAGPAVGGWLIDWTGVGMAFALDATTFVIAIATVLVMRPLPRRAIEAGGSVVGEIKSGFAFVRANVWLWGTFVAAAVTYLMFMGPAEVLLPFLVKNDLGADAGDLGMVFAAGGLGAVACALVMGSAATPRRSITFIYAVWTLATVAVAGYGVSEAVWQLMIASFVFNALETAGTIVWVTLKQRHVPASLLGRVSSLDWLISIGLLPVSFALTGPVSDVLGVRGTLFWAGVIGGVITLAALFLPGMRDLERGGRAVVPGDPAPAPAA